MRLKDKCDEKTNATAKAALDWQSQYLVMTHRKPIFQTPNGQLRNEKMLNALSKLSIKTASNKRKPAPNQARLTQRWFPYLYFWKPTRFHFLYRSIRSQFSISFLEFWFSEMTSLRQADASAFRLSKIISLCQDLDAVFSSSPNQSLGTLLYCVYCLCLFSRLHPAAPPFGRAFFHGRSWLPRLFVNVFSHPSLVSLFSTQKAAWIPILQAAKMLR